MDTPMPPQHRWTIAAFVLALVTAFGAGVWSMTLSPLEQRAAASPAAAAARVPVEQAKATSPHQLRLGTTVTGQGSIVAHGAGTTWIVGHGSLSTIESGDATVVARGPWSADAIVAPSNEGSMWLASGRFLWPVSATGSVGERLTPSVGPISAVLAANGRTWVAGSDRGHGLLAWIDPWTGDPIQSYYVGAGGYQLAATSGYVFVATGDPTQPPIVRLDPGMGASVPVPGAQAGPITAGDGRLWWGSAGRVRCVVARTLRRCGQVPVATPTLLAAHGGALWIVGADPHGARLVVCDPRTGRVVAGPVALPGSSVASIAASDATAWIGTRDPDTVVEVGRA